MAVKTTSGQITVVSPRLYEYMRADQSSRSQAEEDLDEEDEQRKVRFSRKRRLSGQRYSCPSPLSTGYSDVERHEIEAILSIKERLFLPPIWIQAGTGTPSRTLERKMLEEIRTRRFHPQTRASYSININPKQRWREVFLDRGKHTLHSEADLFFDNKDIGIKATPMYQDSRTKLNETEDIVDKQTTFEDTEIEGFLLPKSPRSNTFSELMRQPLRKRPRGFAVIINNYEFYSELMVMGPSGPSLMRINQKKLRRDGSILDSEKLQNLFADEGFIVKAFSNLTANEMLGVFFSLSRTDHSGLDCFICFVASHGHEGTLFGCDCREIKISDMTSLMDAGNCVSLSNKPKCFFLQGCRREHGNIKGNTLLVVCPSDTLLEKSQAGDTRVYLNILDIECDYEGGTISGVVSKVERTKDDAHHYIPGSRDFLLCYSMSADCNKYHASQRGSLFFKSLVECIQKFRLRCDLRGIVDKATSLLGKHLLRPENGDVKEIIVTESTLTDSIYFDE